VPLADAPMRVLEDALRDPVVVARYRAKVLEVSGSDCLWWSAAVSGRGHGRFYVGTVDADRDNDNGVGGVRDLCVIAHRFGYALVCGATALNSIPVLGHGCDNPLVRREALVDRVEVRDLRRRSYRSRTVKLRAA